MTTRTTRSIVQTNTRPAMRVKSRKPLGLEFDEAAGLLEEPVNILTPPMPFKLVPVPVAGIQAQPAVAVAVTARVRQKVQPVELDLPALPWLLHTAGTSSALPAPRLPAVPGVGAAAAAPLAAMAAPPLLQPPAPPPPAAAARTAQARAVPPAPPAAAVSARPTRKRKQTSMGDDMIPPDAIFRPFAPAKTKRGHASRGQPPAAEQGPSSKQLADLADSAEVEDALGQQERQLHVGPCPFKLVGPVLPQRLPPVLVLAGPADIVQLAKQQEEDERRRASEAAEADARVVVRLLPSASRGSKASASGAKSSKQERAAAREKAAPKEKPAASRQRPPRPSRRPTPEPSTLQSSPAPSQGAGTGMWHPGMELHGGVCYVDTVQSVAAKPPPAVVVGTPPRWQQMPVQRAGIEDFSDDPVLASIEFAKHLGQSGGRQPSYSGQLQQAVTAEQRLYKERLQRAMYARDGRRLQAPGPEATRRSTRIRQAPQVFLPTTSQQQTARRLRVVSTAGPEDQTATRMGAEYQAELPAVRPRPRAPAQDEARWLGELVMEPHSPDLPPQPLSQLAEMATASSAERAAWVDSSQQQLSAAVGSLAAISLGLETMGTCIRGSWTEEEEEALASGLRAYGRDFHAIQQDYVPTRTVHNLVDYYYNVWKLKATRQAVQWYQEKAQAAVEREAELERQELAREAELQRKAERQENTSKRRQLRETLQWLRTAAKGAANAEVLSTKKSVVRDRAARASKVLRESQEVQ